jgi:hypothetical protein
MKYMTAKEEDILTNQSYIQSGVVLDKLLQALIVSKINYNDLIVGDKNAIMVAARILGYGSDYIFNYGDQEYTVDLSKIDNKPFEISSKGINEFNFTLPSTGVKIAYKILTHGDEQKIQAEMGMLAYYPKTTIARMPLMFGNATPCASSFMQTFLQTLQEGKNLSLFYDEYRTPISANTAVQGLFLALDKVEGIIHLGGKERISRYQFGLKMAEVFGLDTSLVQSCSQADIPMAAPRPADVSLDSSQAFALGYQPLSIQEELENLRYTV